MFPFSFHAFLPTQPLVQIGQEDDLVRRMGLTRIDLPGSDSLTLRTKATEKILRYQLHQGYIFQKAGQAVMINLENYLVVLMIQGFHLTAVDADAASLTSLGICSSYER